MGYCDRFRNTATHRVGYRRFHPHAFHPHAVLVRHEALLDELHILAMLTVEGCVASLGETVNLEPDEAARADPTCGPLAIAHLTRQHLGEALAKQRALGTNLPILIILLQVVVPDSCGPPGVVCVARVGRVAAVDGPRSALEVPPLIPQRDPISLELVVVAVNHWLEV